jgi:protein TonB
MRGEQSKKHGVYIDVFEQSILLDNPSTKSWSFFASVSAELLALSLAILIPLAHTELLPGYRWNSVRLGAPARLPEPVPIRPAQSAIHSGAVLEHRIFVFAPRRSSVVNPADTGGSFSVEPPGTIGVGEPSSTSGIKLETFIALPVIPTPPQPQVVTNAPSGPLRVSEGVQMAKLMKKVIPEYPSLAKTARLSGVVHLLGVIAKDGTIQNLELISGHPILAGAALAAVRQWVYQPTLLNGRPVEVIAPIDVNFTLGQ